MSQFNDKIKTGYDNIADIWFEKREWYIEQPSIDAAIAHLAQGARILDVGCGSGKQIGRFGGGRKKITGFIDIALIQSLTKHPDIESMISQYGYVIIDECHHIPSVSFDDIIRQVNILPDYQRHWFVKMVAIQLL